MVPAAVHMGDALTSPGLVAIRALDQLVREITAPVSWLSLQVRLRAAADALVVGESSEARREQVQLSCQAYLELMMRAADDDDALSRLQRRSKRYVKLAAESTEHLVAHGAELLISVLSGSSGHRWGGAGGVRAAGSVRMARHFGGFAGGGANGAPSGGGGSGEGGGVVLTHGFCPYVLALLLRTSQRAHFTVIIAEGSPSGSGHQTASEMLRAGVPVRVIEPCAVARCMAQVALVLCGAEAVLGDGGVLGKIGTLTIAYAARAHGRPLYVAAPHFAFSPTHHLDAATESVVRATPAPSAAPPPSAAPSAARPPGCDEHRAILVERPTRDATPPSLVTLLMTDLGVLTPSAIADELLLRQREDQDAAP